MSAQRCVMVCVTRQISCERLIREGASLAREKSLPLMVVHVSHPEENLFGNPSEGEAMDYLFGIAKEYDAQMNVVKSTKVLDTLAEYAKDNKASYVVTGQSAAQGNNSLMWQLQGKLPKGSKLHLVATT